MAAGISNHHKGRSPSHRLRAFAVATGLFENLFTTLLPRNYLQL